MSTILKALRRVEHEKAKPGRPLREQITGGDGGDERAPRRWPVLLGGVVAGVAAGLGVLFFMTRHTPAPPAATAAAAPVEAAGAASQAAPAPDQLARRGRQAAAKPQRPARPAPPAADARAADSDDFAVIPRGPARARIPQEDPPVAGRGAAQPGMPQGAQLAGLAPPVPTPAPPPAVAGLEPRVARPTPPQAAPAPQPAVAAAAAPPHELPPPEPVNAAAAAAPPPLEPEPEPESELAAANPAPPTVAAKPTPAPKKTLAAPEPEAKSASKPAPPVAKAKAPSAPALDPLPPMRVEKTLWHPVAEKRVAVIEVPGHDPQEFREGAEVVPGTRIAVIEPSGVIFRFDGRDIRRKIGE